MRIHIIILILASYLCYGCKYTPILQLTLINKNNQPITNTEIKISSSPNVEILSWVGEPDNETQVANPKILKTNELGLIHFSWTPPKSPGLLARLFGASTPKPGWISLTFRNPDGSRTTQRLSIPAE